MAFKKTKILDLKSLTGVTTVGIFTAGTTSTDAGTARTSYVKGLIAHNTGLATCGFSVYIVKDQTQVAPGVSEANETNRILRINLESNETFFFETPYPITLTPNDAIAVDIRLAEGLVDFSNGGTGISSVVNVQLLGDSDIA
jgi:hypothetical protein